MIKRIFLLALLFPFSLTSFSTHLRGGEITIAKVGGSTYKITLKGYARYASPVKMGGGILEFGDGTTTTSPQSNGDYEPTLDSEVGIYIFTVLHKYSGPGFYRVTYTEQNLDEGIINVSNSVQTRLYLESGFLIDPFLEFSSLEFEGNPIFRFTTWDTLTFSSAPVKATNNIYNYQLCVPHDVQNYVYPENLNINSQTGLLTWDTKFQGNYKEGQYLFAVRVSQFDQNKNLLGYVTRVFTLNLFVSESILSALNPVSDHLGKVVILEGNQKTVKVILQDTKNFDSLRWVVYYDSTVLGDNLTFTQYDSAADKKFKIGLLHFSTTNSIVRDLPYTIILRGRNDDFFQTDISYLIFTKDVDLPIITAVKSSDKPLTIYPNPFSNELYFSGNATRSRAEVYNEQGNKVLTSELDCDGKVDASQLPKGLYIIKLSDGNEVSRFKAIKK